MRMRLIISERMVFQKRETPPFAGLSVGAPRFELGTSSPPDWRANQAAPRPVRRIVAERGTTVVRIRCRLGFVVLPGGSSSEGAFACGKS